MRFPIASGVVDTVLNNGAVTANSTHVGGFAVNPSDELQVSTNSTEAEDSFSGGLRRTADGILKVATSGGTTRVQGLLVDDEGVVIVEASGTPVNHVGGLPVNSAGALCVSAVT